MAGADFCSYGVMMKVIDYFKGYTFFDGYSTPCMLFIEFVGGEGVIVWDPYWGLIRCSASRGE